MERPFISISGPAEQRVDSLLIKRDGSAQNQLSSQSHLHDIAWKSERHVFRRCLRACTTQLGGTQVESRSEASWVELKNTSPSHKARTNHHARTCEQLRIEESSGLQSDQRSCDWRSCQGGH